MAPQSRRLREARTAAHSVMSLEAFTDTEVPVYPQPLQKVCRSWETGLAANLVHSVLLSSQREPQWIMASIFWGIRTWPQLALHHVMWLRAKQHI